MTLGVLEDADGIKNHTFTANFGAGCTVDFEIQVVDHTPDEYLYAVEDFTPSKAGTPGSVELLLSAPRDGYGVCAAAIYNPDHSLKDLTSTRTMLSQGGNTLTLELDFAEGETCSLFLLDGESLAPLSESKTVLLSSTQGRLQDTDLGTVEGLLARMDRITAYAQ